MDTNLLDIIRACSNEDNKEYTHCTYYGPARNWCLDEVKYSDFWKKYCQLVESGDRKKLCLGEIPRKHMPIIVDMTLKFHISQDMEKEDPFDYDFILAIVYCYQKIINEILNVGEGGGKLVCCVLKANPTIEDNLLISRLRLQFPYCKTMSQIQNRMIRPLVLQMFRTTKVISRLLSQPVNEWEDIIDPLSVERPVSMYGSSNSITTPKYKLEYIIGCVQEEDIQTKKTNTLEPEEIFFIQNHEHIVGGLINQNIFLNEDNELDYEFWLPYFLSIYYVKEITLPKNKIKESLSESFSSRKSGNKYLTTEEDRDSPEYLSSVFLDMLKIERAEEEHFWLDIGKALKHVFKGEERGLDKWIDFTEIRDVFTAEDCRSKWYGFNDNKITIRTIAYYAREDSPEEYKRWHKIWCTNSLEKATSCTHADVAEALYRIYWLDFACGNLTKNNMYHFRNHIWKKMDSGINLRNIISSDFLNVLEIFRADVAVQIKDSEDKNFKDSAEILIQKISKLILKLKGRPFKNSVYSECTEKFYIENFEEILDTNPNLMGCCNGLIQTLDKKAVFRDGKPEDYVSKTTGVYLRKDINETHPLYLALTNWFNKMFTDRELNQHFAKLAASLLRGRNADKIFPILTGCGNNSKSMLKKLFEAAFGDYVITFQLSTFTGARTGGPDPSVARSKFAHIAFLQEPDSDVPLKSGVLKEFTGGDRFFARFLHSNGEGEISPMFVLCLICNNVPPIASDKALKNRVKILPFLSEWTKDAPKNPDEQYSERKFPLDPFFENCIPELAPAFLYYCIKHYALYRSSGLSDPLIVQKYTGEYWEEHDFYGQFIKEHLEKAYKMIPNGYSGPPVLDETAFISLSELYSRFKNWFKENYQLKLPDRPAFKTEMENRVTKCIQRNFYGIKYKAEVKSGFIDG